MQVTSVIQGGGSMVTRAMVEHGTTPSAPIKQMETVRAIFSQKIEARSELMKEEVSSGKPLPTYNGKGAVSTHAASVGKNFSASA